MSKDETSGCDDLQSAVATAIDAEIFRQYKAGEGWEEAKDVLECLDYCNVAAAAIGAVNAWQERQSDQTSRCTPCEGSGVLLSIWSRGPNSPPGNGYIRCSVCGGTGKVKVEDQPHGTVDEALATWDDFVRAAKAFALHMDQFEKVKFKTEYGYVYLSIGRSDPYPDSFEELHNGQ